MLVGMQVMVVAALAAQDLQRAIGNYLVGIHVGGGAGAALDYVDHELIVQLAGRHLIAGGRDASRALGIEKTQIVIRQSGSFLHQSQRVDEVGIDRDRRATDGKVLHGAQGMDSVIGV